MNMAAVSSELGDLPIRDFGTFTHDLHNLAAWLNHVRPPTCIGPMSTTKILLDGNKYIQFTHTMADISAPSVDLVVIGSGAAGLMAALTALDLGRSVTLVEADSWLGGATALSEGMIWVPNSPEAREITEAPEPVEEAAAALTYLRATSGNFFDQERAQAYVNLAPQALALAQRVAGLKFMLNRVSQDYYAEVPGATKGRRALNPVPAIMRGMDRKLFARLRWPLGTMLVFGGLSIASRDVADYQSLGRSPAALARVAAHVLRYGIDRLLGWPRGTRLANGNVIAASLAQAVYQKGGVIVTDWPIERLWLTDGRVVGVVGPRGQIFARLGVVVASGGLNAVPGARAGLVGCRPHVAIPAEARVPPLEELVAGSGAAIVSDVSQPVLWAPTSVVPNSVPRAGAWPHFADRGKPGVICLGPDGRRFANEAQVYHDFVPAMIAATGHHSEGAHCWIVTDHPSLRRYGLGPVGPFPVRLGPYLRAGYLKRGESLEELARAIGLPPSQVCESIARFNAHARIGRDEDFGRGDSTYDLGSGDATHKPNPSLGPLEKAPFYAIRIVPGDIGTFVGLRTDAAARVLNDDGCAVPGLWAAGSAAAPITGGSYPAAGLTIGQAMTFGHVAALDACAGNGNVRGAK